MALLSRVRVDFLVDKVILKMARSQLAESDAAANSNPRLKRLGDAALFAGVIVLSTLAVTAVAILAPIVLTVSALTALFTRKGSTRGWRPVAA